MVTELIPEETNRAKLFNMWKSAPVPFVSLTKTFDVTNVVRISRKRKLKFTMLLEYCIGKAASSIKEFYLLPANDRFLKYDTLGIETLVINKNDDIGFCCIEYNEDLNRYNEAYMKYTKEVAEMCKDRFITDKSMVIITSAIIDAEIDSVANMNFSCSNPFIVWGRYRKRFFSYYLPVSFHFNHIQMDGNHAMKFLKI